MRRTSTAVSQRRRWTADRIFGDPARVVSTPSARAWCGTRADAKYVQMAWPPAPGRSSTSARRGTTGATDLLVVRDGEDGAPQGQAREAQIRLSKPMPRALVQAPEQIFGLLPLRRVGLAVYARTWWPTSRSSRAVSCAPATVSAVIPLPAGHSFRCPAIDRAAAGIRQSEHAEAQRCARERAADSGRWCMSATSVTTVAVAWPPAPGCRPEVDRSTLARRRAPGEVAPVRDAVSLVDDDPARAVLGQLLMPEGRIIEPLRGNP